uniref:Uncharacterized protein LOC111108863 n=1 Tax=Crassostrea virginica TaxID=6565 RepID=A0A8B8BB55_CRAVI|nr:uncharacterized protein LOC111108863 [Crassostrea virginica]
MNVSLEDHAVVAVERSKAYLTNYSKNFPVILNEKPIEIGKELNNGDVLAIGGRKFLFNREEKFDSDSDLSAETSEHPDPVDCHSDLFAKTSEHRILLIVTQIFLQKLLNTRILLIVT